MQYLSISKYFAYFRFRWVLLGIVGFSRAKTRAKTKRMNIKYPIMVKSVVELRCGNDLPAAERCAEGVDREANQQSQSL
jgi:hypothetical protein